MEMLQLPAISFCLKDLLSAGHGPRATSVNGITIWSDLAA